MVFVPHVLHTGNVLFCFTFAMADFLNVGHIEVDTPGAARISLEMTLYECVPSF